MREGVRDRVRERSEKATLLAGSEERQMIEKPFSVTEQLNTRTLHMPWSGRRDEFFAMGNKFNDTV